MTTQYTGSIEYETKRKSLQERWLMLKKETSYDEANPHEKVTEQNVHVKFQTSEKSDCGMLNTPLKTIGCLQFIPTYNKWFVCDVRKQNWKKGIGQRKNHLLWRIVQFDHSMGKWNDCKPYECVKWGKKKASMC